MHEFNLDKIWQESEPQAEEHYQKVEGVIIEMAIRKSQNVLQKVLKIAFGEMVLGSGLVALVCALFWPKPIIFWSSVICFSIILAFSWHNLNRLQKRINAVHTFPTTKAIQEYISILEAYQNRVSQYLIYFTPLTFLAGVVAGLITQAQWPGHFTLDWTAITWLVFSIAALYILVYYARKAYLPWSVGGYIEELKTLGVY